MLQRRLAHNLACISPRRASSPCLPPRPTEGVTCVTPTTDAAIALSHFEHEGFCVLKGVLSPEQVQIYRDHMLGVLGDNRFIGPDRQRRDPATRRFTEPDVLPPNPPPPSEPVNEGQGRRYHNGDFGPRYGDELRTSTEGYIRHDPRWAVLGCETARIREVIEPLVGSDFRVVYTDAFVDYPGAKALGWHADGPSLSFNGKALDASPRITTLWMLSDFTEYNGGAIALPQTALRCRVCAHDRASSLSCVCARVCARA